MPLVLQERRLTGVYHLEVEESRVNGLSGIAWRVVRHRGVEERGMEQKIYRERNRAWNREWKKRFGDGSVIEADEVAFGQGKTLTEELLKAQVSFEVIPRGLVLREGKLVGVLAWLIKGKDVNLPSAIKEANSSMLFVSKEDFVQIYVASLTYNGSIVELYRYTPRVYPIYYRKKQIHYENTSFEDALQFKVEDFPVYVRDSAVFRRVKEGKYLADLWKDGFIDGGVFHFYLCLSRWDGA